MTDTQLHVVALDVPFPPDYGGAADIYHRLRALGEAGVGVTLHCFRYVRPPAPELEALCTEVHYYPRPRGLAYQLRREPFIVATRRSAALRQRLMQDGLPVLLEGLHCSALLHDAELRRRHPMLLRMHNVEADYYRRLSQSERSLPRRAYLALEAAKLRRYEPPTLLLPDAVLAIGQAEAQYALGLGARRVAVMPSALPVARVEPPTGLGAYALFHGKLSVAENNRVAAELIGTLGPTGLPLVVAGHRPPAWLRRLAEGWQSVRLVPDPPEDEMRRLVAGAQVCLMFTHQPTGLKQKLLRSLAEGRHVVANPAMTDGTGLGPLCRVVPGVQALPMVLPALMAEPFTPAEADRRRAALAALSGTAAVQPLIDALRHFTPRC